MAVLTRNTDIPAETLDESQAPSSFPLELVPPGAAPPLPGNALPNNAMPGQPTPAPADRIPLQDDVSSDRRLPGPPRYPAAYPPQHPGSVIQTMHVQPAVGNQYTTQGPVVTAHYQPTKRYPTRPLDTRTPNNMGQPGNVNTAYYQYPQDPNAHDPNSRPPIPYARRESAVQTWHR